MEITRKWMNNQMETFNLNVNLLNKILVQKKRKNANLCFLVLLMYMGIQKQI